LKVFSFRPLDILNLRPIKTLTQGSEVLSMFRDRRTEREVVRTIRALGKGLLRTATLFMLLEGPKHGYEVLKELTKKTAGLWRPSPGSLYPILRNLEEQRYVVVEEVRRGAKVRRTYSLTLRGKAFIALFTRRLLEGYINGAELDALDEYLVAHLEALKEVDPDIASMVVEYLRRKIEKLQHLLKSAEEGSSAI